MDEIVLAHFDKAYSNAIHNVLMSKLGHCILSGRTCEN